MKLEANELLEPQFNKHLGDNRTSLVMGESLGSVTGLEFEASMLFIYRAPVNFSSIVRTMGWSPNFEQQQQQ